MEIILKKLNLRKKDIVYFGIDGITQESYEKYRVKGNLQKVLENHKELKKDRMYNYPSVNRI